MKKIWRAFIQFLNSYNVGDTLHNNDILSHINANEKVLFTTTFEVYRHLLISANYITYANGQLTIVDKIPDTLTIHECKQRTLVLANKMPANVSLLLTDTSHKLHYDMQANKYSTKDKSIVCDASKVGKQLYVKNHRLYNEHRLIS